MRPALGNRRRLVGTVATLLAAAGLGGLAQGGSQAVQITVTGDSVIVVGLPAGRATVEVTRPDARTKTPVVIGRFSGQVRASLPFTANTTVPNPVYDPEGDCWQAGALHLPGGKGLTPDIRPGDTVSVVGGPSLKVAGTSGKLRGPIAGCAPSSLFAENAVTDAPASLGNARLVVSGVAQPLATSVSVSASDGTRSTTPVAVVPGSGGRWTATIPAAQVGRLAKGRLTVAAVFAVPDVGTGAAAHIAGTPAAVKKVVAAQHRRRIALARYAKQQASARGWGDTQWRALQSIARPESAWDPCAVYPSRHDCAYAGAASCGVAQAQPCPPAWRGRLWRVRFAQVRWLLDYIETRYGDPLHALWFRQTHTWY